VEPGQGAEGGGPDARRRIVEEGAGGVRIVGVPGDGGATAAFGRLRIGVHDADIVVGRGKGSPAGMSD
jgi:hypothetical protein